MNALTALSLFAVLAMAMGTALYYPGSYVAGAYAPVASAYSAYSPVASAYSAYSPVGSVYSPVASSYSSVVSSYSPVASSYLGYQPAVKSYYTGLSGIGGYSGYAYPYGVKYV